MFRFWRKSPAPAVRKPPRSENYGGMRPRELQARLELLIDPSLKYHRGIHDTALFLSKYNLVEQNRFLAAVERIAQHDTELAYRFCRSAAPAISGLPDEAWQAWIAHILQTHAVEGRQAAVGLAGDFSTYRSQLTDSASAVSYAEIAGIMESFIQALSGHPLKLDTGESRTTDMQTLYFPESIDRFTDRDDNFRLYKACAVHQWAQSRFGTWDIEPEPLVRSYPDRERALRLFHRLETIRLDACIARELPGMARDMRRFRMPDKQLAADWRAAARSLAGPQTGAGDSIEWLQRLYKLDYEPPAPLYQAVLQAVAEREETQDPENSTLQLPAEESATGEATAVNDADTIDDESVEDGAGAEPPPAESDYTYDEWDQSRQRYRKHWCQLREEPVATEPNAFRRLTLQKYHGLHVRLRRSFEAMRKENRRIHREPDGEDIDIDAVVDALSDLHSGLDMSDRLFVRTSRDERNVATLFLLDMSASTSGWVNEIEREALVLMCEALEQLGDRYAVYGFSGRGHANCISYPVKAFGETYNEPVWERIGSIKAQQYTRMGVAIRHHSAKLLGVEARTRLLVVLSDGRPDDQDGYRGSYGIEDTRKSLLECRLAGIHPFCITIDSDARDYLPHMFGRVNFTVIDHVEKLPYRIGDIYRRLTT